ncbi:MAG: hypothetical protein ACK452_02240 [Bacteroidota bacterium]|jgi:hypothetical protein
MSISIGKLLINQLAICQLIVVLVPLTYRSQDQTSNKHYPSILLGVGSMKFTGDVGKNTSTNPISDARVAYYMKAEYRFGKHLGLMLGGIYGKLAGNDFSKESKLNFQSKALQADLSFVTYFDHLFKNNQEVSPYFSAGIGYLLFDPYGDLKNGDKTYNYWSDGSIRDLPESPSNLLTANFLKRDYTYETQLKDSLANYSRNSLTVPIGLGLDWQIGNLHRWDVQLGFNYNLILSDYVDNYKSGANDSYVMAHVGIKYTFSPKPKPTADELNMAEIDTWDYDEDGVPDNIDKCLSTPKGVAVDKNGCPPDADEDGVPDYKDKESNTQQGAFVDEDGVTVNLDSLAYRQIMWDSTEVERRKSFEQNPNIEYLSKVEEQNPNKKTGDPSKIPAELRSADANKDGYISVEEIAKVIDGFFEGTNQFNVDSINKLIDYFFDQ